MEFIISLVFITLTVFIFFFIFELIFYRKEFKSFFKLENRLDSVVINKDNPYLTKMECCDIIIYYFHRRELTYLTDFFFMDKNTEKYIHIYNLKNTLFFKFFMKKRYQDFYSILSEKV